MGRRGNGRCDRRGCWQRHCVRRQDIKWVRRVRELHLVRRRVAPRSVASSSSFCRFSAAVFFPAVTGFVSGDGAWTTFIQAHFPPASRPSNAGFGNPVLGRVPGALTASCSNSTASRAPSRARTPARILASAIFNSSATRAATSSPSPQRPHRRCFRAASLRALRFTSLTAETLSSSM